MKDIFKIALGVAFGYFLDKMFNDDKCLNGPEEDVLSDYMSKYKAMNPGQKKKYRSEIRTDFHRSGGSEIVKGAQKSFLDRTKDNR